MRSRDDLSTVSIIQRGLSTNDIGHEWCSVVCISSSNRTILFAVALQYSTEPLCIRDKRISKYLVNGSNFNNILYFTIAYIKIQFYSIALLNTIYFHRCVTINFRWPLTIDEYLDRFGTIYESLKKRRYVDDVCTSCACFSTIWRFN